MSAPASFDRDRNLARLADETFDVLVVGGGITGAGVALDAAARGLRTALVEGRDFASGTSSRSSKLVHGGLRYLEQREYGLVRDALVERQRLLANAPHLVRPLPFLIPLFGSGASAAAVARGYSTALWLYDVAGGAGIGRRHRRLTVAEARSLFPALGTDGLVAAFVYWDAHADDARLTLAVARTAALDHGAVVANYAPVTALRPGADGSVHGAHLGVDGGLAVDAAVVVNATGVWADQMRGLEGGGEAPILRPAKGVHVTVRRDRLPLEAAAVLPVPGERRSIFVVPWEDRVYLGTTDTEYDGPLDDPRCTAAEVDYVLGAVNHAVDHAFSAPLTPADVMGTWAGLRPLLTGAASARTADLSRRHRVTVSRRGVVTVAGGKLTTYRRMASETVDQVLAVLGRRPSRSPTRNLRLRGATGLPSVEDVGAAARLGTAPEVLAHLRARHGGEARVVAAMVAARPQLGGPLVPGLPYLGAEAVYAARYEMARTLDDVLSRRTRATVLSRDAAADAAPEVAALLAGELGWDAERTAREVESFRASVTAERAALGLPALARTGG